MKSIEENTEQLDLLERTLMVEEKQKQRLKALALQKERDIEECNRRQLYEGHSTTSAAKMDQEDTYRKELLDDMVKDATPSNAPIVKVLTNVHGNVLSATLPETAILYKNLNIFFYLSLKVAWGN